NELFLLTRLDMGGIRMFPITIPTSAKSEPIQLKNVLGMGTLGCHLNLRLSDQEYIIVTPYLRHEYEKIKYCDFSCAQAAMLYRIIQDKQNNTAIASIEEHNAVQEVIPDAYTKALKKELL